MAFLRNPLGDDYPWSSDIQSGFSRTLRWLAIPCAGIAVATWSMVTLAGLHSAAALTYPGSFVPTPLPTQLTVQSPQDTTDSVKSGPAVKAARLIHRPTARMALATIPSGKPADDRFAKIVAEARLSRETLTAAFARAGSMIVPAADAAEEEVAMATPVAARFHRMVAEPAPIADRFGAVPVRADPFSTMALGQTGLGVQLAYAAPAPGAHDPFEYALASLEDDPFSIDADDGGADMPESVLLPPSRPKSEQARMPAQSRQASKPAAAPDVETVAYAKPDKPAGNPFKKLFNGAPSAGDGVAIYDISASVVYMPDGSRLEAHSGIGKAANNPRYVHVKMAGPTPPNTYKLTMREKRFHGVEAIRMTPVGDGNMHGRDGMLAHSYLLRGGRPESHGCVAFKDYPKFLKAFKQGKVKTLVVVPSLSRAPKALVASNGRGA